MKSNVSVINSLWHVINIHNKQQGPQYASLRNTRDHWECIRWNLFKQDKVCAVLKISFEPRPQMASNTHLPQIIQRSSLWETESNAFLKSRYTMSNCFLLSTASWMIENADKSCVRQYLFFINPNWYSDKLGLMKSKTIDSKTLDKIHRSKIGL